MATVPYKSRQGFADANRVILSGIGLPTTAGNPVDLIAEADAGGVGSTWTDIITGRTYEKHTAGAGVNNWESLVRPSDVTALTSGSWREGVVVIDTALLTTTSVITAMNVGDALNGVAIAANDRILLAGLTTAANVYIVGGSTGAWTLTEDTNTATAGDVVYVVGGAEAGQEWQFNAAGQWIYVRGQLTAEDSFMRAFIGKSAAGAELPAYINTNFVTSGASLEASISDLDGALFTLAGRVTSTESAIASNIAELDTVEASVGLSTSGVLAAFVGTTYLGTTTTIRAGLVDLDTAINGVNTTLTTSLNAVQVELDATQVGAGLSVLGAYVPDTGATVINSATSLHNATQLLDVAHASLSSTVTNLSTSVGNTGAYTSTNYFAQSSDLVSAVSALDAAIASLITSGGITVGATTIILDSVSVDAYDMINWDLVVTDAAAPSKKLAMRAVALHDGTAISDATKVDDTDGFELDTGLGSVDISTQLNGVGAAQTVQLVLTTAANVTAKFSRTAV